MSQEKKVFKTEWAGRSLTIETGQLAKQAMALYWFVMEIQSCYRRQLHQKNLVMEISSH